MQRKYKKPFEAKLSVIIPAYNSQDWIGPTLNYLWASLQSTHWQSIEIIVVDDGSSDSTAEKARSTIRDIKVKIIKQPNSGRLAARKTGLMAAKGDYVFFLDSRVYAAENSFKYMVRMMNKLTDAVVWNGHVEVERKSNPYARFWHVVAFLAWRKYFLKPKLSHYNIKNFDYYPKGTGCFFAPRDILLNAYDQFHTDYADDRNANDDTSLIRHIAKETDIYVSPNFRFTYNARSTLKGFIRHTKHRGIVFIDGYLLKGTRYYRPLIIYLLSIPIYVAAAIFYPVILLIIPAILLFIFLTSLALRVGLDDAIGFTLVFPLFVPCYTLGLYQGLYMKLKKR